MPREGNRKVYERDNGMKKNIAKYFWDLNKEALKETEKIIKDSQDPKFAMRLVTLLSRCQEPRELFSFISKDEFIKGWPKIKSYWLRVAKISDFRDWWQTIYEQLLQNTNIKQTRSISKTFDVSLKIGNTIKEARMKSGLSQKELALKLRMKQPDISKIEKGKQNITLETLTFLCKALAIKKIEL